MVRLSRKGALGLKMPVSQQDSSRTLGLVLVLVLFLCLRVEKSYGSLHENVRIRRKAGKSLNLLVVGDWGRKGLYNQSQVAAQMGRIGEELNVDFVISTGDNFYENGLIGIDDTSFEESFSEIYTSKSLQTQWYSVLGNHDYRGDALAQLSPSLTSRDPRWLCQRSFRLKYTLCPPLGDCALVEFFFVDTTPFVEKYWEDRKHKYDWRGITPRENYLKQQLQELKDTLEASSAAWKIVIGHHTIRSIGSHGETTELVEQLLPILESYGVDVYMNGHDHCLEHISSLNSPLEFLTSGGGSKAWRGMEKAAKMEGVRFYHDGQGFLSLQITSVWLNVVFYDGEGRPIHHFYTSKGQKEVVSF